MEKITIGELARKSGLTLRTIRYYEEIGLISSCIGKKGNARVYPAVMAKILKKVIILKEAGCSLDEIRSIFSVLESDHTKNKELTLFLRHTLITALEKIKEKKEALANIERNLANVVNETSICDTCQTPNRERDCKGCENLSKLRDFGLENN
ncbi:MAG: hypothetical protein DRP87_03905 [Spirochaetes bacterium]|nr:MAG: hypothetical protein DRP87_03905 [Spirochaetota bacterium]